MENPKAIFFEIIGNAEFILAHAGLYRVVDRRVEASGELLRVLEGNPATPEMMAALIRLVYVCNAEKGGAINVARERMEAMEAAKKAGLDDSRGEISKLSVLIRKAVEEVGEERRNAPPFVCGTTWAK